MLVCVGAVVAVPAIAASQSGRAGISPAAQKQLREAQKSTSTIRASGAAGRELRGLSDREALEAAVEAEPGLFAATPTRLLTPRGGQRVKSYLGDYVARLDVPGQASDVLAVSDLPLRVDTPAGKRPVDLALTRRAGRFEPVAPLADVSFPALLGDGVELADGVGMRLIGAAGDASGVQKGQQVFYANALPDADVFVTALPRGVESFVQLRSAGSPRELSWQFDLPEGAALREVPGGRGMPSGAEVVRGDETLARIWPAVAKDGADRPVGVTSRVEGTRLVLSVDVPADATYPILVDPIYERMFTNNDPNDANGTFADTLGWRREATRPLGDFDFSPATESVHGGPCLRISGTPNPLPNTLCVGARIGVDYGLLSAAGWAWHPPAGLRTSADNLPAPDTDAYIFRADVRHSWLFFGGSTALYGGLISGRTQTFVGFNGPPPNLPASENGGPGHAGQFTLPNASVGQGSNVSFFRT